MLACRTTSLVARLFTALPRKMTGKTYSSLASAFWVDRVRLFGLCKTHLENFFYIFAFFKMLLEMKLCVLKSYVF
jgi:hypothetical protein